MPIQQRAHRVAEALAAGLHFLKGLTARVGPGEFLLRLTQTHHYLALPIRKRLGRLSAAAGVVLVGLNPGLQPGQLLRRLRMAAHCSIEGLCQRAGLGGDGGCTLFETLQLSPARVHARLQPVTIALDAPNRGRNLRRLAGALVEILLHLLPPAHRLGKAFALARLLFLQLLNGRRRPVQFIGELALAILGMRERRLVLLDLPTRLDRGAPADFRPLSCVFCAGGRAGTGLLQFAQPALQFEADKVGLLLARLADLEFSRGSAACGFELQKFRA